MLTDDDAPVVPVAASTQAAAPAPAPIAADLPTPAVETASTSGLPMPAPALPAVSPLSVSVQPRTGIRNLRGKPTAVPTGHLDIMVDGKQRAWTRVEKGYPIRALAEFLPHEIPQLQAAVVAVRGDETSPVFRPLPSGTNEEINQLAQM